MAVESATYIAQLNAAAPVGADFIYEGDDQFRMLKGVMQAEFQNFGTAAHVTVTQAQLNTVVQAITVPEASGFVLAAAATRANKLLTFDGAGAPSTTRSLTAFDTDVTNTATNAGTASTQAGLSTTARIASEAARDLAQSWSISLSLVDGTYYGARKYAIDAAGSASAAATSATTAQNSVAVLWNSSTTFAPLATVISPITLLNYRRTAANPGPTATDPSLDGTNYVSLAGAGGSTPDFLLINAGIR